MLGGVLAPKSGSAQDRQIVSNQVNVSGSEASLQLGLSGGEALSVSMADGNVTLDGEVIGRYEQGGALERSWRSLLGDAVSVDAAELPDLLRRWTAPPGLSGDAAQVAERIRSRVAGAFEAPVATQAETTQAPAADLPQAAAQADGSLQALMGRSDRLRELAAVADQLDIDNAQVHVDETVRIEEGETVDGTLLLVDSRLQLDGTVDGDVILLGGSADLGPESRITGSLRNANADVSGRLGAVSGGISEIEASSLAPLVDTVVREIVREAPNANENRNVPRRVSFRSPWRSISRGLGGLLQTFITFALAFAVGLGILYFFPRNLEVVSRTAREAPGRSLLVGMAGIVLAVPIFVVGIFLLAVSIVGIPLLLVWIPVMPLAVCVAILLGYLGVARNLGRWCSGREFSAFEGLDTTRPAVQIGCGLAVLLVAYALANVFEMAGSWLGVFEGFFMFAAGTVTVLAASIGLGAVILSRAGRSPAFAGPGPWDRGGAGDRPKTSSAEEL